MLQTFKQKLDKEIEEESQRFLTLAKRKWRTVYPKKETVVVIMKEGMWSTEIREGRFLKRAYFPWNGKITEEKIVQGFLEFVKQGMSRKMTLLVNFRDLRIKPLQFPPSDKAELAETIIWEEERIFRNRVPHLMAWRILENTDAACHVLVSGIEEDTEAFWEKAARRAECEINRAVPIHEIPLDENPHFILYGRKKEGILCFISKTRWIQRNVDVSEHGKGLFFMRTTSFHLNVKSAKFYFCPLSDCGEEERANWRSWIDDELHDTVPKPDMEELSNNETEEENITAAPLLLSEDTLPYEAKGADEIEPPIEREPSENLPAGLSSISLPEEEGEGYYDEYAPFETPIEEDEEILEEKEEYALEIEWIDFGDGSDHPLWLDLVPFLCRIGEAKSSFPTYFASDLWLTPETKKLRLSQAAALCGFLFLSWNALSYGFTMHKESIVLDQYEALSLPRKEMKEAKEKEIQVRHLLVQAEKGNKEPNWTYRLVQIADHLPQGVVLQSISHEGKSTLLKGSAMDRALIYDFQKSLEREWNVPIKTTVEQKNILFSFTLKAEERNTP